jgi:hypothetical protein
MYTIIKKRINITFFASWEKEAAAIEVFGTPTFSISIFEVELKKYVEILRMLRQWLRRGNLGLICAGVS